MSGIDWMKNRFKIGMIVVGGITVLATLTYPETPSVNVKSAGLKFESQVRDSVEKQAHVRSQVRR